jgi:hypothetical protein
MFYVIFFLGDDSETGKIVDDCFVTDLGSFITHAQNKKPENAEWHAKDICRGWDLKYIDSDGPFGVPFWPNKRISQRPKWADNPPSEISRDRWAERLKSTDELKVYRAAFQAGRNAKSKKH